MTRIRIEIFGERASGKSTLLRWLVPALRAMGVSVDCVIDSGMWSPYPEPDEAAAAVRKLDDLRVSITTRYR